MRWLALCLVLTGCGPSCEEQGGHWVQDGFFYVYTITDVQRGTGYMQAHPNIICKKDKQ